MKTKILTALFFITLSTGAKATCTPDDLTGQWGGSLASTYNGNAYACLIHIRSDGFVTSSACYDSISFTKTVITSGTAAIEPSCIATIVLQFDSNITATIKAMVSANRDVATGTYSDSADDTGTFSVVKAEKPGS